jgi:hypothetical protein
MTALAVPISETRRSSLGEPGRPPRSLNAHRRILEAIRRGDAPGARQAMRRHVKMVADIGLLRWSAAKSDTGDDQADQRIDVPTGTRPGQPDVFPAGVSILPAPVREQG